MTKFHLISGGGEGAGGGDVGGDVGGGGGQFVLIPESQGVSARAR